MKLEKMFEMQRVLDERIIKAKGLEGKDLLPGTILALRMELGELANELPEYTKHWSSKKNNIEKALVEYVDGFHFILSIGLQMGCVSSTNLGFYKENDILTQINKLFNIITDLSKYKSEIVYIALVQSYNGLSEMLGFSKEQVEQAYIDKNKVNHERQESGY